MPYEFGKTLIADESRQLEFKTVSSANPVRAIADVSDVYAVAFLNSQGGTVLWGIRDIDKTIVGVALTERQRDEVRRAINDKLHNIEPKIDPTRFRIEIEEVHETPDGSELFIVSLSVPRVTSGGPFFASGSEAYVRLDGANRKLTGPALTAWIVDRTSGRKKQPSVQETIPIEIYNDGRKLPMGLNVLYDFRSQWGNDRPSLVFDFHLPPHARGRRKKLFGLVTSPFITVVADWGREWAKLTVLPDGHHFFQSEMMALNLLPGAWHKYTFSVSFPASILDLDRVEDMAFRLFSEEGTTDIPFGVWMIGAEWTPAVREQHRAEQLAAANRSKGRGRGKP